MCGVYSPLSLLGPLHVPQHWSSLMQPPVQYQPLMAQLEQISKRVNTQQVSKIYQHVMRSSTEQYVDLIRIWQSQQSPIQQIRMFTIDELIQLVSLKGMYKGQASHRYVAEALRRCGFISKRDWSKAGRNKRYWVWRGM